jgi:outer membrane protein
MSLARTGRGGGRGRHSSLLILAAVMVGSWSLPARADAQYTSRELPLEVAVGLALEHNPIFKQQASGLAVARSAVRSAYGSLAPSAAVSAGFGYTAPGQLRYQSQELGEQPDFLSSDYGLRLSYQVNGTTLLQPAVERARERAAERRLEGAESQLEADVTRQYLQLLQARERHRQSAREVERTEGHVRLAQGRLEVGAGTPLDVRRAEVQHGQAEVRQVQAENAAAMELLRLAGILGVSLAPDVELTSRFEVFEPRWTAADLVDRARAGNPGVRAAKAGAEAAEVSARATRSQYLPTLNVSVGVVGSVYQARTVDPLVQQQTDRLLSGFGGCVSQNEIRARVGLGASPCVDPRDPSEQARIRSMIEGSNSGFPFGYARQPVQASIGVSLPLFTGLNRQHQVQVARAAADDARHQSRAEELRLQQEVTGALLEIVAAHRTSLLQERVRAAAEEELRLATDRFRFGSATSIEVTDAQTNLSQAEIQKIEATFDFHRSLAALEALVGEHLR